MTSTMGSGTASSQQQAAAAAINNFLTIAPKKYWAVQGTVGTGSAGGATAVVNWQQQLPIIPAFCSAIDYNVTLPVTLTLTATTGTATLSPFAPYSAIMNQVTLGGAPPWPLTELTPWYMDQVAHGINYDPNYPGYGNNSMPWGGANAITDEGPFANQLGGVGSLWPGETQTNLIGSNQTYNFQWQFKVRQILQRKRHLLWGAIPFGDPENRPYNLTQISPLIGVNPEQNLFVNSTGASNLCVTNGTTTVQATYELEYIDLLPPGLTAAPNPLVGYALQLVQFTTTGISQGVINPITHRTAQIYTSIHQLLINGQLPVRPNYMALWDDQDQQSARWTFDANLNTLNEYFDDFQRRYRHYPLTGQFLVDFEGGLFPEIPSVTPYDALVSPDASYAQAFGVPVTPALTTSIRLNNTANNPYIRTYAFGLVRVPY